MCIHWEISSICSWPDSNATKQMQHYIIDTERDSGPKEVIYMLGLATDIDS